MRKIYLSIFVLSFTLLIDSCSKDEERPEPTSTDISVISSETIIYWTEENELPSKIENSLTFNFGNASASEINRNIEYNFDSTRVKASIGFKDEFKLKYSDSNQANNSVSIELKFRLPQEPTDENVNSEFFNSESTAYLNTVESLLSNSPQLDITNEPIVFVPIKFHDILQDSGTGNNLDSDYIPILLERLNSNFEKSKIEFIQCGDINLINDTELYNFPRVDYSGLNGVDFLYLENIMQTHNVSNVLNIYFPENIEGAGGFYPGFERAPHLESMLVVDKNLLKLGLVMEHEIGHWLYLQHTHGNGNVDGRSNELVDGSNCSDAGDRICDTPADPNLYGLVTQDADCTYLGDSTDANGQQYVPNTTNIMSYTYYQCRNEFSQQQLLRMGTLMRSNLRNFITSSRCDGIMEQSNIVLSDNLNFGNVLVNTTSDSKTLTISNTGNSSFEVTEIVSSNTAFTLVNPQSRSVAPNSSSDLEIQFLPTSVQDYSGTITVTSNADNANSSNSSIQVNGTGIEDNSTTSFITLEGDLNFGNVQINQTLSKTLTISNTGDADFQVFDINVPIGFSSSFNGTVTAGSSTEVSVSFSPTTEEIYNGTLTVNHNADDGNNSISISGTGTGIPENVLLSYSNSLVKDGDGGGVGNSNGIIESGEEIDLNVQLFNSGTTTATNVSAELSTNDSDITITDSNETWNDIPGGTTEWESDFDFSVSENSPSKTVTFDLVISSDQGSWTDSFTLDIVGTTGGNPQIDVGNNTPRDNCSDTGSSNNYRLDLNTVYFKQNWNINNIIGSGSDGLRGMWYRFRTSSSGQYNIGVSFSGGNAGFQLFNSCDTSSPIITSNNTSGEGEVAQLNLNGNTDYFIRFYDIDDNNPVNFIITIENN